MEFGAKFLTKFTQAIPKWGKYVLQRFVIEVLLECLCPAKIHPANGFLEKKIGQYVLPKFDLGGLIWKAQVEPLDFAIPL
jgi:hypothetical protein